MRSFTLYLRLALQAMRNNRKFYLPYFLALAGNVAAMYIMSALVNDPGMMNITPSHKNGYMYVQAFMTVGIGIAVLFSAIFIFYINGFLMRQRKKELGLYNILGMGKGNIALVLLFETLGVAGFGIGGGLLAGILFHKLATLFLYQMLGLNVPFGFAISGKGMAETALIFAVLLGGTLLWNLMKVRLSRPVELLRSASEGEREPKIKWFTTLLGVITLGSGYWLAIRASNGVEAMELYFIAVGLVIIGTYCLFSAVSIFILKTLQRNKRFYYQTGHFIGVSGMLYRMRRNATGLGNICILCTMVMVMISGTLSLYLGTEQIVHDQYPADINVIVSGGTSDFNPDTMLAVQQNFIQSQGYAITSTQTCTELSFGAGCLSDGSYTTDRFMEGSRGVVLFTAVTESYYTATAGETLNLQPDQVAAYGVDGDSLTIHWIVPEQGTTTFSIAKHLSRNPRPSPNMVELVTVVVRDEHVLEELYASQKAAYGDNASEILWYAYFDIDAPEEAIAQLRDTYANASENADFFAGTGTWASCRWELQAEGAADVYSMAGGFLFLGIILGIVFLMATVLILYYKQISEGYEDKARFEILQKVGLSREEVRSSLRGQILTVFFLPIAVAAVHIAFDFNMVVKLLTLFYLQDITITALCTAGTVLAFFVVYGIVYFLTARIYYRIVERA